MSAVPIIATLVGLILGFLVQTVFARLSQKVAALNDQIAQVDKIESLAVEYWLAPSPSEPSECQLQAAKLRGAVAATSLFRETAEQLFASKFGEYDEADFELFDLTTGGDFEQVNREPNPGRVIEIIISCQRARRLLRNQRTKIYWAY